jgi:hypothetical protein
MSYAVNYLFKARTTTGTSSALTNDQEVLVFQGTVTGTGAVSATINIEASLDGGTWVVLPTLELSGTTSATDWTAIEAPWPHVRGNLTAISGTGAAVDLAVGRRTN